MDDNVSPASSPPESPGPADLVAEVLRLAGPRQRTVDDHMFRIPAGVGRGATARLQLFTAPGMRSVAVVTQTRHEGMSLTNAAESFAAAVWEQHCAGEEQPPVWIQRQLREGSRPWPTTEFELVTFREAWPFQLRTPGWRPIDPAQLEELVGTPVAEERGSGYVPREPEPERAAWFEVMAVCRLAKPLPFRTPACMPSGIPWWRRWLRQVAPRRGARTCCWYHGGDWHQVNSLAREVLSRARKANVPAEDMEAFAQEHAEATGVETWQIEALITLFDLAVAIHPYPGGYVNGQHRAQAMLEAGVRRTVVLRAD